MMRHIDNPEEFRLKIRNELSKIIDDEKISSNMEKGIYNNCIHVAGERNIVKKWDNIYFSHIYLDRLRSVYSNLRGNPSLVEKIKNKEIKAHMIGFMTHQEMKPEKWKALIDDKKERDKNKYSPKIVGNTDQYTCRKCKSTNCSYYQLQTRSVDEPMTTFVQCLSCGCQWKC